MAEALTLRVQGLIMQSHHTGTGASQFAQATAIAAGARSQQKKVVQLTRSAGVLLGIVWLRRNSCSALPIHSANRLQGLAHRAAIQHPAPSLTGLCLTAMTTELSRVRARDAY